MERVPAHKHCRECGTSIPTDEEYCSKACKKTHDERVRGKRRQMLLLYFVGVGLFALAMVLLYVR